MTTTVRPVRAKAGHKRQAHTSSPRVAVQRTAPKTIGRHVSRTALRLTVLVGADVSAYAIVHSLALRLSEVPVLSGAATFLRGPMSGGFLGGWNFALALVIGLAATGTYVRGDGWRDVRRIGRGVVLAVGLVLWRLIWTQGLPLVVFQFVAAVAVIAAAITIERHIVEWTMGRLWPSVRTETAVIVGNPSSNRARRLSDALGQRRNARILGWVWSESMSGRDEILGPPDRILEILQEHCPDMLILSAELDERQHEYVVETATSAGCRVLGSPRGESPGRISPRLVWYGDLPFVSLALPSVGLWGASIKRAVDVVGAFCGLIVLSPLFALVALAVRLDSTGRVFYGSKRWGRFGRVITVWKFRTMVADADDILDRNPDLRMRFEKNIKIAGDPRVTRVGRFLRKTSLDEFPQLWSVLVGDMSLVGPRPKLLDESEKYGDALETVLSVRPGLTGLWQISGRSTTTYSERITLDLKYVDNLSFWGDLDILLRTLPVVLKGTGAH